MMMGPLLPPTEEELLPPVVAVELQVASDMADSIRLGGKMALIEKERKSCGDDRRKRRESSFATGTWMDGGEAPNNLWAAGVPRATVNRLPSS